MSSDLTEGLEEFGDDESGDEYGGDESGDDESGAEDIAGEIGRDPRFAGIPYQARKALARAAMKKARGRTGGGGRGGRPRSKFRKAIERSSVEVKPTLPKVVQKRVMQLNEQVTIAAGAAAVVELLAEEDFIPKKVRIVGTALEDMLVTDIKLGSISFMVGSDGIVASALASDDGFLTEVFQDSDGKPYKIRANQRLRFFVTNRGAASQEFAVHVPGVAEIELSVG